MDYNPIYGRLSHETEDRLGKVFVNLDFALHGQSFHVWSGDSFASDNCITCVSIIGIDDENQHSCVTFQCFVFSRHRHRQARRYTAEFLRVLTYRSEEGS